MKSFTQLKSKRSNTQTWKFLHQSKERCRVKHETKVERSSFKEIDEANMLYCTKLDGGMVTEE